MEREIVEIDKREMRIIKKSKNRGALSFYVARGVWMVEWSADSGPWGC